MSVRPWQTVLLLMLLALGLSGCSGYYTFNDRDYRALGEPLPANRGK